jgi:uncharacterized protein DUF4013
MDRIADAFVWPVRDPDWLGKVVIMGLILLIPIAGGIDGLGWMLASLDRLRVGEEKLPPANFNYLRRGAPLFIVFLVYFLGLLAIGAVLFVPALLILNQQGRGSLNVLLVFLAFGLLLLTLSVVTLGTLALTFATPSIVLAVDRGGIGEGLRVDAIVGRARRSPVNTLIAGLMLIAAEFVGQLGGLACLVGVVFTSAYALAMQAWIIRSYEVGSVAQANTQVTT